MQNQIDISRLIPDMLEKLHKYDNARLGMFYSDNIYYMIPKFLFKYKSDVDPNLYSEIKKCVEVFEGNLKWTMYHDGIPRRYRIIMPELYATKKCAGGIRPVGTEWDRWDKSVLIYEAEVYSEEIYKETCEKAIEDIPLLAKHIQNYFEIS